MDIVTIDFETYYDKDYSLSKITTEQYVRSPDFEIIGVGVKVNNHPTDWYSGDNTGKFLTSLDYHDKAILCHNTAFDGAILSWHFGIKPKLWLDTLSMARPLHNVTVGGSLKALAQHYGIGEKGTEVVNAMGKRRADFTPEELARYAAYCVNDVEITYQLFKKLSRGFPIRELMVIDQTLRMYTEPVIELDVPLLEEHLAEVRRKKEELLAKSNMSIDDIMSNPKFAKALQELGVEPPRKVSARTGKETWAFAKTDKALTDLQDHPDERVQALVATRLGVKSTLEETRTENLIGVAERGCLPIMLNYYGAHTGRYSGGDKLNLQNLPSRGGNNTIRRTLKAPDNHKLIACDSSQIEARMVAYIAEQQDLVQAFREGRDVYCEFASDIYGREITKADKIERFVGKSCLSADTRVLTREGWKRIVEVSISDYLWDGEEWVQHQGVCFMGVKPIINLHGVELTGCHEILTAHTNWEAALHVQKNEAAFQSAVSLATSSLSGMKNTSPRRGSDLGDGDHFACAADVRASYHTTHTIYEVGGLPHVINALKEKLLINGGGFIRTLCQMSNTGVDFLIEFLRRLHGATPLQTVHTSTTADAGYRYAQNGGVIKLRSYAMSKHLRGGIDPIMKWIGSMWTGITSRTTSALYPVATTLATNVESQISKPVYDILNSGSRHRFTILTDAGPIIVHNCILSLGYGAGAAKFKEMLRIQNGIVIEQEEAERIVRMYRQKYHKIVELWRKCDHALKCMLSGREYSIDPVVVEAKGIRLPSGFYIQYPELRMTTNGFEYINDARQFRKNLASDPSATWTNIYGGKVTENIVQALAAIVIREQSVAIGKRLHVVFQVHDEIVSVAPAETALEAEQYVVSCMSTPPVWAPDLPVACESGVADNYGDT